MAKTCKTNRGDKPPLVLSLDGPIGPPSDRAVELVARILWNIGRRVPDVDRNETIGDNNGPGKGGGHDSSCSVLPQEQ
ncbi:hypothetical protein PX52LOC_02839 [Limnoglobus roseus]|uniref:Uncharacterized protein n=1 Tax=Limnoglobus roseus TaxID=2598579 RepID=A0A5C1ACH4_9BACT|nr:hypothetical protein PX52LOC_02839 [Limnoglobus roseus]